MFILWLLFWLVSISWLAIVSKIKWEEYLIWVIGWLIILANIFSIKIIQIWPFVVPAGILVFSLTFFATDLLSEKWWKKYAIKAVNIWLLLNVFLLFSIRFINQIPSVNIKWEMFNDIFSLTWRIVLASIIVYVFSQYNDIFVFDFLKKKTGKSFLWLRNNLSTIISQLIDSVFFIAIAFYGILPIGQLILGQWIIKVIIALLDTPFIYTTVYIIEKKFDDNKKPIRMSFWRQNK